jgi:hypothetical protein
MTHVRQDITVGVRVLEWYLDVTPPI